MITWPVIEHQPSFPIDYYSLNKLGLVGELDRNEDELFSKSLGAQFKLLNLGLQVDITSFVLTCIILFKKVIIDCSMSELVRGVWETNQYQISHTGVLKRPNPGVYTKMSCLVDIVNLNQISNDFSFELKGTSYTLKQFRDAFTDEFQKQLAKFAKNR